MSAAVVQLLREARRARGITMEELADRAGVDRTYIGLLERGERRPTIAIAARIASSLGLTLGEVISLAEQHISSDANRSQGSDALDKHVELVPSPPKRRASLGQGRMSPLFTQETHLDCNSVIEAIESAYHTLDLVDEQLLEKGSDPLARLVELANLSSILGNLLGAGMAEASRGIYQRNGPHRFPDLLPVDPEVPGLEIKTALEGNRPKGHLAKPGAYLTFRYVLASRTDGYIRGKEFRGDTVTVWEVKFGFLEEGDFDISNTDGDSGKTAVIKTTAFRAMELLYFDPTMCPAPSLIKAYGNLGKNVPIL